MSGRRVPGTASRVLAMEHVSVPPPERVIPTPADAPCAWLTTLRRDGSPHVTPVWFLLDEHVCWVATSTVTTKVANMLRDPRVALAVDGTGPQPAVAQGIARVHHDLRARPRLLARFAAKYDGWDAADESQDGPRVVVEIRIDRWLLGPGEQV